MLVLLTSCVLSVRPLVDDFSDQPGDLQVRPAGPGVLVEWWDDLWCHPRTCLRTRSLG
ncbi:MAG: hypothetical protein ACI8RZ_001099 [Myxococcota bacterium]|jgi:hypothetical protein